MRSLKLLLVAAVFSAAFIACETEDLNEDDQMLNPEVVSVTTGGQVDEDGGID